MASSILGLCCGFCPQHQRIIFQNPKMAGHKFCPPVLTENDGFTTCLPDSPTKWKTRASGYACMNVYVPQARAYLCTWVYVYACISEGPRESDEVERVEVQAQGREGVLVDRELERAVVPVEGPGALVVGWAGCSNPSVIKTRLLAYSVSSFDFGNVQHCLTMSVMLSKVPVSFNTR